MVGVMSSASGTAGPTRVRAGAGRVAVFTDAFDVSLRRRVRRALQKHLSWHATWPGESFRRPIIKLALFARVVSQLGKRRSARSGGQRPSAGWPPEMLRQLAEGSSHALWTEPWGCTGRRAVRGSGGALRVAEH